MSEAASATTSISSTRRSILLRALEAAFGSDSVDVSELFTGDVKGWSPAISVESLEELEQEFEEREEAVSEVVFSIDNLDMLPTKAIAEWRFSAVHSGPLFIADDFLIEPTGRTIVLAGATIADFRDEKICSFRCYFDDAALLEQLLTAA